MSGLLDKINTPADLKRLPLEKLPELAEEIRQRIIEVVMKNGGHLASSLGVVELTIALHYCFDLLFDRLVLDVGHQCYAHKLLTGRRDQFDSLRKFGGISGFPNKFESPFDPFTVGHAGTSVSTGLGLATGDTLTNRRRKVIVVIGDGAIASGMPFEALNHGGVLQKDLLVILNDNEMSISRSVGSFSRYLNRVRLAPLYQEAKKEFHALLNLIPIVGQRMEKTLENVAKAIKSSLVPGHIFEELGFSYYGPVDGHQIKKLVEVLNETKRMKGFVLLHVLTQKGKGYRKALRDPTSFHGVSPKIPEARNGKISLENAGKRSYTQVFSETLAELAAKDKRIVAITAAMPDGTGLRSFGKQFPRRYFDTGITEQHAVGFAGGLAASGLRPVAAIYSTFLQRAFDQVFHDVCLQKNPVVFAIDRAGLVGEDGATHNGMFDIAYLRILPEMRIMAPADAREFREMLALALKLDGPSALRYPRGICIERIPGNEKPVKPGRCVLVRKGEDGIILALGSIVAHALDAAQILSREGIEVAVINARFVKPLDKRAILRALSTHPFLLTVEEHALAGGFGSAVLEAAMEGGGDLNKISNLGIPDCIVEHGSRAILFKKFGLDASGIAAAVRKRVMRKTRVP